MTVRAQLVVTWAQVGQIQKCGLFDVKFPVESRDDIVFWICEIFIEIFGKSNQICRFCRKKCIPVEQLFKADSPYLAGTITIKKAARGYPYSS